MLAVLGGLVALGPLSTDAYVPGLPRIAADLDASASSVQLTVSTVLVGLALGQLVAGPLSDALGRRRPLLVGLVIYALANGAAAVAPTVAALVALRAVQGLSGATVLVVAYAMVRDMYDETTLARRFAALMLVTGIAPVLAPLLGAGVLRLAGWRAVFVALAAIAAALLVPTWRMLPDSLPAGRRRPGHPFTIVGTCLHLLGRRQLMGYTAVNGLVFSAMFAYIAASPFVLQRGHGLSVGAYSAVFAVNALGLVAASQLSARWVGRIGVRRLTAVGVAMSMGGAVVLAVTVLTGEALWPLLAGFFVVVSSVGLVLPNAAALALADEGANAGSAAALLGSTQFLLGGVAASVVGAFHTVSAVPVAIVVIVVTLLAGLTVGLVDQRVGAS